MRFAKAALAALCSFVFLTSGSTSSFAQEGPPKHEFRGAWVASVTNLDWPVRGASTEAQQEQLRDILDGLQEVGINAVIFQVRPEADALYDSELEPWSYWLTGEQGTAPEPYYDPLQFAIQEAHARGMELHAWFNPYRAERVVGDYPLDENHVASRHPEWTFSIGDPAIRVLDPGLPEVREFVTEVVTDVVRRYDIDGVHFDDYFYPYPPNQITDQDDATFAEYDRGFTNRGDWRRDNINLLMEMVHDSIDAVKPHVKFGVSPFGIWKSGVPSGIVGMDAHSVIYADPVAWMENQWLDYLTPQLYWKFGGGQDYGTLAPWWADQRNGRHLYPGIGAYKADGSTFWNPDDYSANEVPRQLRFNREHDEIHGSVIFRSSNLTRYGTKGLADSLQSNIYARPALTPPMPWKSMVAPEPPVDLDFRWNEDDTTVVEITWSEPVADEASVSPRRYAVYHVYSETEPDFAEVVSDARNLIAVTGETSITHRPAANISYYYVTAVSANSVESSGGGSISLIGRATSTEGELPMGFSIDQNYPNPFSRATVIEYELERPADVRLRIFNALGHEVATLVDAAQTRGQHAVEWDARGIDGNLLPSGTYFYSLEAAGQRLARPMVIVK